MVASWQVVSESLASVPECDMLLATFWILITAPTALKLPSTPLTNCDLSNSIFSLSHILETHGTSAVQWEPSNK